MGEDCKMMVSKHSPLTETETMRQNNDRTHEVTGDDAAALLDFMQGVANRVHAARADHRIFQLRRSDVAMLSMFHELWDRMEDAGQSFVNVSF